MAGARLARALGIGVAVVLAIAVLYPTISVIRTAFLVDGQFSTENIVSVFTDPATATMAWNTFVLTIGGAVLATVFGTGLAIITTLLPSGRLEQRLLQLAPLIPMTIPPLVGAVGWLLLLSPRAGWLNIALRTMTGDQSGVGPISVYSMPVVVWVMGLYVVPYVYTIMAASLSRLSTELLEGYQVCGCTAWGAVVRAIVGPLRPAFLAALALAVVHSLSQFAVPLILEQDVLTTHMQREVAFLGNYGRAAAIALPLFVIAIVFTLLQIRLTRSSNRYATVTGRGGGVRELSFGPVKDRILKGTAYAYMVVAGVLPIAAIIAVSLLRYWSASVDLDDISFANYVGVATNAVVQRGAFNSLWLAVVCALAATFVALLVTVLVERFGGPSSQLAYFFANLPLGIPLVLFGLAFLLAFIAPPIVLYGTIWILLLAYVVAFLPIAIRNVGPLFQQISGDLEEAALVSGASRPQALRKVTVPLIMPGLAASGALLFVLIFREFPMAAFISTPRTNVISMALLDFNETGRWPYVAVIAMFISLVSVIGIVTSNVIAGRFDLVRRTRRGSSAPVLPTLPQA